MEKILNKVTNFIKNLTKKQKIIMGASCAAVLVVLCVGVGLACYYMDSEAEAAKQTVKVEKEKTEKPEVIVEEVTEPVVEPVVQEPKKISFSGTSIEKDLKIKIVDETGALVTGVNFRITVTAQKAKEGKEYVDDDTDGIIYISNMTAGKYTVQLHEAEGFAIAENTISINVKDKIEYKKVDVKNEIKSESEVNVKQEDALTQKEPEESKVVNTVELLESTKKEVVVAKENIDFSNFSKATSSEETKQETILDTITVTVPGAVVLYNQGDEKSKSYLLDAVVVDENQVISGYTWQADVEGVFTITQNGNTSVTLSAVQQGTANLCLTVEYEDGVAKSIQSKELQIAVTVSDFTDDKTQLKDKEGGLLYLDKDAKQPATLKDYSVTNEYYGAPKYTGWQTIDGKTYYYDANHKAVTGVQVIGGARYTFGEDGALLKTQEQRGIDVSKWQGNIDWNAVANAGIDFAIIRVGYRGYTAGTLVEDSYFKKNIEGATKAGIKVGVYFFTQAITEAEAVEEASMAISLVSRYKLHLPIYFDTEAVYGSDGSPGRANNLGVAERTAITKAFCETVRNAGYMPGVYASTNWYNKKLNASQLETYAIWVAHYADACGYKGRYDMWQHTSSGSVPGINGRVDLNISYVAY